MLVFRLLQKNRFVIIKSQNSYCVQDSVLVLSFSLFVSLFLLKNTLYAFFGNDLLLYIYHSSQIIQGDLPSPIVKHPGTGLWIALYRVLSGDHPGWFHFYSVFTMACLPVIVYNSLRMFRGRKTSLFVSLCVLLSPSFVKHSSLSEAPAAFSLAFSLFFWSRYYKYSKIQDLMIANIVLFFGFLCRAPVVLFFPFLVISIVVMKRGKLACFFSLFMPVVMFILFFFYCEPFYGKWGMIKHGARSKFTHFYDGSRLVTSHSYVVDYDREEFRTIEKALRKVQFIEDHDKISSETLSSQRAYVMVRYALKLELGSYAKADDVMAAVNRHIVKENLYKYMIDTGVSFLSFLTFFNHTGLPGVYDGGKAPWDFFFSRPEFNDIVGLDHRPKVYDESQGIFSEYVNARYNDPLPRYGCRPVLAFRNWYLDNVWMFSIPVYLGVLLLLVAAREVRLGALGLLITVFSIWGAYSSSCWFDIRYLSTTSWLLWVLSGLGYGEFWRVIRR